MWKEQNEELWIIFLMIFKNIDMDKYVENMDTMIIRIVFYLK